MLCSVNNEGARRSILELLKGLVLVFVSLSLGLFLFGQDSTDEVVLDEIVARVNQDVVTKTELDESLRLLEVDLRGEIRDKDRFEQVYKKLKRKRLQELIETKLMLQKANDIGLALEVDRDVELYLQNLMDENNMPSLQVLGQALQQRGSNLQSLRNNVRERMIVQTLQNQVVYSRITLLTSEIEAYYQDHQEDYSNPPQVTLSEIAILYEDKSAKEARDRAQQVLKMLQEGNSFEVVATEHSEGATASRGGDIGPFQKGILAENLERIVFELEIGQTTGLIEHEWGNQIIKVTGKKMTQAKPLEEVRSEIQMRLYVAKATPELDKYLKSLIKDSFIFVSTKYRDQFDLEEGI